MLKRHYLVLVTLFLFATACGEDEPEDSSYDRPEETLEFITDAQLDSLIDVGAVVYEGDAPPSLTGTYDRRDQRVLFEDNENNIGRDVCYSIWTLEATSDEYRYDSSWETYNDCDSSSEGLAAYVSGQNNCFTLYTTTQSERDGCEFESIGIKSGCLVNGDIEDFMEASIALERPGSACQTLINNGNIPAEGNRFVIGEGTVTAVMD